MDASVVARSAALIAGVVALVIFWDSPFVVPVRMLPVLAHEAGHALAAWATGGTVERISLRLDESGETLTRGGLRFLILNAGYLSTLFFGVAQLVTTSRGSGAKHASFALGVGILALAAFFLRPILSLGFGWCVLAGLAFMAVGARAPEPFARGVVRGMGLFCVLYAFRDIVDDVFFATGGDASMLAELTGIPAVAWGTSWILLGVAMLFGARRAIVGA